MAFPRPVWTGFVQFSLVTIPVRAYTAGDSGGGGRVQLNHLHADCHSRIRYAKTCPLRGEVPGDRIVSGYEFADGRYVVIDPAEVDRLRTPKEKAIAVEAFVPADRIDARYLSGRHYYLLPDGEVGQCAYAVLVKALAETRRAAFVTAAAPRGDVAAEEVAAARAVVIALSTDRLDLAQYRDDFADKMMQLIEARTAGREVIEAKPEPTAPQVANLMEALKRSLDDTKARPGVGKAMGKPENLGAPSAGVGAAKPVRKRKTS